jgi:hypothetical protein
MRRGHSGGVATLNLLGGMNDGVEIYPCASDETWVASAMIKPALAR